MSELNAEPNDLPKSSEPIEGSESNSSDSDGAGSDSSGSETGSDTDSDSPGSDTVSDTGSDHAALLLRRYELLDEIGNGAIGTVYSARDTKLGRKVAIKVLHPDRLSNEQIARLHREAKIIGQINHPSVVEVYDFDITSKNEPVMVMELLKGESLHDVLQRTRYLSIVESLRIFIQICDAMEHAHKRGLIHRDLKTGNIMIVNDKAKILDFGMAKDATSQDTTLTEAGRFLGTPSSISPEQASGENVDHRTDIYSLGCLMYETLTGRSPFDSDNSVETILKQINEPAPPLKRSKTSFPEDLDAIVARALKKKPSQRFESMHDMKVALQQALARYTGEPIEGSEHKDDATAVDERVEATQPEESAKQGLTFSHLEGVYQEPNVVTPTKTKSSLTIPAVVIGVLALTLACLGFTIIGMELQKPPSDMTKAPQGPQSETTPKSTLFIESVKNNKSWHQLIDPITPEKLDALLNEPDVTHLNLSGTKIDNTQLQKLIKLPLDVIDLRNTSIGDDSLKTLSKFKNLRSILLDFCPNISPAGIETLRKLPDLRVLAMAETGITNKHVEAIAMIRTLRFLRISRNPKITDASVPYIVSLPTLTSLAIGETSISKFGLLSLQKGMKLSYIGLKDHNLTDNDITELSNSICLIDLNGNKISGKTLKKVGKLDDIWFVDIRNCPNVTAHDSDVLEVRLQTGAVYSDFNENERGETSDTEWYFEPTSYNRRWKEPSLRIDIAEWQEHFAHPNSREHIMMP